MNIRYLIVCAFVSARGCAAVAAAGLLTALSAAPVAAAASIPVTVTNTPTVNSSVTNSTAKPLFVDTGSTARNGFNATCFTGNVDATYGQAQCELLAIPAGRQVVIETVSCQAVVAVGSGPADVQLIVPNPPLGGGAPANVSHFLTLSRQDGNSSLEVWRTTTSLRAYAGSPTGSVSIYAFFRTAYMANVPASMVCAISGYMVGQ